MKFGKFTEFSLNETYVFTWHDVAIDWKWTQLTLWPCHKFTQIFYRITIFHFSLQATFKSGLATTENVTIEPDPQIDKLNHKCAKFSRIAQIIFQFAQKMSQQAKTYYWRANLTEMAFILGGLSFIPIGPRVREILKVPPKMNAI